MPVGTNTKTKSLIQRLTRTDELKQAIFGTVDIVKVATDLCDLELEDTGHQHRGQCPFHEDSTPSFYLTPDKGPGGVYYCFGCKEGGDAIDLLRKTRHLGYQEALTQMAELAGVDITEHIREPTDRERQLDDARDVLGRFVDSAAAKYGRKTGSAALRVKDAGLASEFQLGVTGAQIGNVGEFEELGRHTESVVFPYFTPSGQPVTIKTRPLTGEKKTYGLSNKWPLHEPVLFGIQVARDYTQKELIVVEGEWDCLALHEHDLRNTVAIGGSSWTKEHSEIIRKIGIERIVFWFDGDEAGKKGGDLVAKHPEWFEDLEVRIAWQPDGRDPEDVVRSGKGGAREARTLLEQGVGSFAWLLEREIEERQPITLTDKFDFIQWLQKEHGSRLNGMQEALVLRDLAIRFDVPEAELTDFVNSQKSSLNVPDSEKVVLSRCVRDQRYYSSLRRRINEEDFFVTKNRRVWRVLQEMVAAGLEFDPTTVKSRALLAGVDTEYIDVLIATGETNLAWHEDRVIEFSVRRSARKNADIFRDRISDLTTDATESIGGLTHQLTSQALGRTNSAFTPITDQADSAMELLLTRQEDPDALVGLNLGPQLGRFSQTLQGLQTRRFVLVAATSSRGKSTMTIQWAVYLSVIEKVPVDFVSLEMDSDEILFKACAHLTGIDSLKITGGVLSPEELGRVQKAMKMIRMSPLRIYVPDSITPSEFVLYAREAVMERKTEVFVIDYAQMVSPDPDFRKLSKYEQLGHFAYTSKLRIARALDVTVVACAQLTRGAAEKERPTMEDMGDSYDLARAADVVVLLHSNQDEGAREVWIDKNRQGASGVLIPIEFDQPTSTFREIGGGSPKLADYLIQ